MSELAKSTSTFIWDAQTLLRLLKHPSESVQEWAASHILELYPETAAQAIQLLPQASAEVALHLLRSLNDLPLPEAGVEPLKQLLKSERESNSRSQVAAILVRNGIALDEGELASIDMDALAGRVSTTKTGFEFTLKAYLRSHEASDSLLRAVARGCNAGELFTVMADYGKKVKRRVLGTLEELWERELPDVRRVNQRSQARRMLGEALSATAGYDQLAQARFPILAGQLQRDRERITALLKAAEEREAAGLVASPGEAPLMLACVLALYRDAFCGKLLSGPLTIEELWRCLTTRPWQGREVDSAVVERLRQENPEAALSALRVALSEEWSYFTHAMWALEAAATQGRNLVLREALDGDYEENVSEEASEVEEAIIKAPGAIGALLEQWRQDPPAAIELHKLEGHPTEDVVGFLLDKFDYYMAQPSGSHIVEAMQEVASQRFIAPLVREWREGEIAIAGAVALLAELHGMKGDKTLKRILSDAQSQDVLLKDIEDVNNLAEALASKSVSLPLRCTVCKRTYRYELERVLVRKKLEDSVIDQIVQCKGCGSLETHEITKETKEALSLEAFRVMVLASMDKSGGPPDTPLIPSSATIMAAGKTFKSRAEAYHYLLEAVKQEPENAELQRRLGNLLANGLRLDLALPYYQEAVRLDPKEIEAVHGLAEALVEQERYKEAAPYLEALVPLLRDPDLKDELGRTIFEGLLQLTVTVERKTGRSIKLLPPPGVFSETKQESEAPPVVQHFDFDLSNPRDFDDVYHLFRYGSPPKGRHVPMRREPETEPGPYLRQEPVRVTKVGRNEPCPCGSGKKYKRCCGR